MLLENKVAIVTGAAKGIGLATAERLAREGASILMADLDEKELNRAADLLRSPPDTRHHDEACGDLHRA